jgi:hypothetical protein
MVKEKKTKLEEAPKVVELIDHSNVCNRHVQYIKYIV